MRVKEYSGSKPLPEIMTEETAKSYDEEKFRELVCAAVTGLCALPTPPGFKLNPGQIAQDARAIAMAVLGND